LSQGTISFEQFNALLMGFGAGSVILRDGISPVDRSQRAGEDTVTDRDSRGRVRRRGVSIAAALAAASLALSGCFESAFSYYSHRTGGGVEMYFKVPAKWHIFSNKQLVEAANGPLSQSQINEIAAGQWEMSFSAAASPSIKKLIDQGSSAPNGFVFTKQLTPNERDGVSFSALRALILGADPLGSSETSVTPPYNVLSYSEFTRPGGIRGSKLVTNVNSPNNLVKTFAQVIAIDPRTNYVYGIGVACKASCWGPNSGLINQVLNSWNIKVQSR
jgi:hypothetical protein